MSKREDIERAVACDDWQEFRKSLKGKSTKDKLSGLILYIRSHEDERFCCSKETMELQVINYIHALARAGLIQSTVIPLTDLYYGHINVIR